MLCRDYGDDVNVMIEVPSRPLEISRYLIDFSRRFFGVLIEAENKPGVLASLSNILAKHGVNILFCLVTAKPSSRYGTVMFLADVTYSDVNIEDLVSELKQQSSVSNVQVINEVLPGFIMDVIHFPLTIGFDRAIILTKPLYRSLIEGFRHKFGESVNAILWHQGYVVGLGFFRKLMNLLRDVKLTRENIIKIFLLYMKTLGMFDGILKKIEPSSSRIIIQVHNSFECELGKEKGVGRPYSHFIRGIFSGFFSQLLNSHVEVIETKCIAKGDPYCEFLIRTIVSPSSILE